MNGGLIRLREMLESLNPSESKIASYILQHPDEIIHLSVAELAQKSGSSQAAIVRLCKSIGFKGYQELKIKVAGDLHTRDPVVTGYQEIRPNDTVSAIMQNVSSNNIQSIRDTLTILDPAMVELAVEALDRARRIYFFGVGASNLIAMDAQQKFLRINKTSLSFADPHVQLTSAITADSGDTAVCISYSGETKEVIRAAALFKEQGGTVISIAKYGNSTLSRQADIPLCTSSTENEIRSGAMASRITQLNLIDILYLAVASRNYEKSVVYLEKSRQSIKQL
ncbi:DNA-binding MurR/RpiR family transcriptional regulator [Paenibacillus forsythiae]|uniref:DNA-binding MurR/RpiR family transcriptional regulator n=1 Tax=Paenibacillus forsythiae TaxID=365616 RepID=A0ABU3H288_9BACL|nr:MurR/RpiR family transcriptional regulator [Paenibacillus forsythiae]MDT3424933.1 DNA-binding MurR/RpiR family transcriptional regulator [Paenibacillus forsythiae]